MIGVMVCGHGKFATGLKTAMELISGQHENVEFFDFSEGKTTEEVDAFYQESINKFGEELENVVVLTDLARWYSI